jgi:DNA-binding NarL/FixJ family response regulator
MMGSQGSDDTLEILLIEDHTADANLVRRALLSLPGTRFEVFHAARLAEAFDALTVFRADAILLDLGLPDSQGLATFSALHERFPLIPIIVLSGLDDASTALTAVRLGAQDYLVKGEFDERLLGRAIAHSIERQRLLLHVGQALAAVKELHSPDGGNRPGGGSEERMIALCAWCKRIHDDLRGWLSVEQYLATRAQAMLTHGTCPECSAELRKEMGAGGTA